MTNKPDALPVVTFAGYKLVHLHEAEEALESRDAELSELRADNHRVAAAYAKELKNSAPFPSAVVVFNGARALLATSQEQAKSVSLRSPCGGTI